MKIFGKVFFDSSVGLGDAFVMNAIIRHYARMSERLYYPARAEFWQSVKCLYKDVDNIEVWPFHNNEQEDWFVQDNGLYRIRSLPLVTTYIHRQGLEPEHIHIHWPEQIYDNFDIPFKMRYLDFQLPKEIEGSQELYEKLTEGEKDYLLFHRFSSDSPNGIPIDLATFRKARLLPDIKIIEIQAGQTDNMLQYKTLIENAKEIHCIPSSFFNLVDSLVHSTKASLFFHDIRKNSLMRVNNRWNNNRWDFIDYGVRV
jgi:hypothetical protein